MATIRIAIAGAGNCASSLIQGLEYYKDVKGSDDIIPGLMHNSLGKYLISDIKPVAAFDVDKRKVGKDLSLALFAEPNCTKKFSQLPEFDVEVMKGQVLDGVAPHMKDYFQVDEKQKPVDVASVLKRSKADVLIKYLPVGSEKAVKWYASQALEAGCGFINCIPVFIASNEQWAEKFRKAKLPVMGDVATGRGGQSTLPCRRASVPWPRGAKIDSTYQ